MLHKKRHRSKVGFFSREWLLPTAGVLWAQWEGWDHTAQL